MKRIMKRDLSPHIQTLQNTAVAIGADHVIPFSDLTAEELQQFLHGWQTLSPERRREILKQMVEVTVEYFEYNFDKIFRSFLHDPEADIRLLAVDGLWEDMHLQLIPDLCYLLENDSDYRVRAAAAMGLGRFVDAATMETIDSHTIAPAIDLLRARFNDPLERAPVRRRALESLSSGREDDIEILIESAYYADDPDLSQGALHAMGRTGDAHWVPFLLESMSQGIAELRCEAVEALGLIGDKRSVEHIGYLLQTEADPEVRLAAIIALGQIGGEKAREILAELVAGDDVDDAAAAETAISELEIYELSTHELVSAILESTDIEDEEDDENDDFDFWEDPLDAEIRRLLDDRDNWMRT